MILMPRETVDALKPPEPEPERGEFVSSPSYSGQGVVRTGTRRSGGLPLPSLPDLGVVGESLSDISRTGGRMVDALSGGLGDFSRGLGQAAGFSTPRQRYNADAELGFGVPGAGVVERPVSMLTGAGEALGAGFQTGDRLSGAGALRGALRYPSNPFQGAAEGFIDPFSVSGRDIGSARVLSDEDKYPFNLSPRDIGGGLNEALLDPTNLLGLGAAKKGALAYRDLTENMPMGMSVRLVADAEYDKFGVPRYDSPSSILYSDPRDPNVGRPRPTLRSAESHIAANAGNNILTGDVDGKPVWSNGFMAVIGENPPASLKGDRAPTRDPAALKTLVDRPYTEGPLFKPVVREERYKDAMGGQVAADHTYLRSEDGGTYVSVDTKYLSYFLHRFGDDIEFRQPRADGPFGVVKAGKSVGLLMPVKDVNPAHLAEARTSAVQFDEAGISPPNRKATPRPKPPEESAQYDAMVRRNTAGGPEATKEGEQRLAALRKYREETGSPGIYEGSTGNIRGGVDRTLLNSIEADSSTVRKYVIDRDDSVLDRAVEDRMRKQKVSYNTSTPEGKAAQESARARIEAQLIADREAYHLAKNAERAADAATPSRGGGTRGPDLLTPEGERYAQGWFERLTPLQRGNLTIDDAREAFRLGVLSGSDISGSSPLSYVSNHEDNLLGISLRQDIEIKRGLRDPDASPRVVPKFNIAPEPPRATPPPAPQQVAPPPVEPPRATPAAKPARTRKPPTPQVLGPGARAMRGPGDIEPTPPRGVQFDPATQAQANRVEAELRAAPAPTADVLSIRGGDGETYTMARGAAADRLAGLEKHLDSPESFGYGVDEIAELRAEVRGLREALGASAPPEVPVPAAAPAGGGFVNPDGTVVPWNKSVGVNPASEMTDDQLKVIVENIEANQTAPARAAELRAELARRGLPAAPQSAPVAPPPAPTPPVAAPRRAAAGGSPPRGGNNAPPGGTPPPTGPGGAGGKPPPQAIIANAIVPGEKPSIGLLRRYEGAVNTQGLEIRRDLDRGNRSLKAKGVGRPTGTSRIVERSPEMEDLFKALHGEGPVPARFQDDFNVLKAAVADETAKTVGFSKSFMPTPDYFPRGWKEVEVASARAGTFPGSGGGMGATPGFAKPREGETFSDMLKNTYTRPDGSTYRLEPVSWNPYEQLALRRMAGAEFREQTTLIDQMKKLGVAVKSDGPLPEGYRVPRVGVAFEGKPKIAPPDADNAAPSFFGYTDRYAVPDNVANVLENMYGRQVSLGKPIEAALSAGLAAKRVKLLGSLFQQVDFATRTGFASFGGALDALLAGKPVEAAMKIAKTPVELVKLVTANLSSNRRSLLRDEILSGKPVFAGRPGITLRGVSEAGWNQADISILRRDVRSAIKDSIGPERLTGRAARNLQRLEAANQRGLFDGVYPQAQTSALKNWILPRLIRQHPNWTDEQIMGTAATEVNKAFSTLGDFQTIFKNPFLQHLTRNLIFSTNEAEALLRGAASVGYGGNKRMWATYYSGGFLFLAATANLIHMASTTITEGQPEPLPLDRYNPVKKDERSPVGISYRSKFLAPDAPFKGEDGRNLTIDLVGQMDTVFRVLDPVGFASARESVVLRALSNQLTGEDYYGNPIDTVGPKGIVSRATQLASDLYEPIGVGQIRQGLGFGGDNREPVGGKGALMQGSGVNLRAESLEDSVRRPDFSYNSLRGEQQLKVIRPYTWKLIQDEYQVGDGSFYDWQQRWIDELTPQALAQAEADGKPISEGEAKLEAIKAVNRSEIATIYRRTTKELGKAWAEENPKARRELIDREMASDSPRIPAGVR